MATPVDFDRLFQDFRWHLNNNVGSRKIDEALVESITSNLKKAILDHRFSNLGEEQHQIFYYKTSQIDFQHAC